MSEINVLVPTKITDAMLTSSTIAEPSAGETEWVSGGTYVLGDPRIRTATHRVYKALIDHTGRTVPPENDPTYWDDYGPTNRWAAFDTEVSTASSIVTPLTYVLRPGFFNSIGFYGLNGADISVSVKDAPGGSVIYTYAGDLLNLPLDWYDWAFGPIKQRTKLLLSGILPYPDAELTLSITAATGVAVGVGMIAIGDFRSFLDGARWGGAEAGATAEPVNFSLVETNKFGTTKIIPGRTATDLRISVKMPSDAADYFLESVKDVLSTPCGWVVTEKPGYDGLNTFGLGAGPLRYNGKGHAQWAGYVKGLV